MEYHDEQASQSIDCQDASVTTKVITEKGRQFDSSIEALLDALHDQYVTPSQHASVDKSGSRSNRRVSFGDTRRPLFKMGITPRGKDHSVRFKKPKKRRVSQTEDGDEAYERSENAIVHVPKSLVNAIAKKIHNQVMGDVLQRMTPNQEYKKLVQRVEKLEQEPMESEHDKIIDHERMEEHIRDLQTRLNQHDEDVKQSREHQGDTRRLERQLRGIQSDMAGQGECKRLASQLQELRSAMERQDNDIMQLKDTMKQGMTSTHGDQERLQHQMEDGQRTQERLALRVGQVTESIHHDRQQLQQKHVAMESKVRGLEQLVQQANTASEEAHKSGQALTKRVDQMGREIYETQVRILTEQLGEERKLWDIRFGRLEEWLTDTDKQRREQTSQDSARMDQFSDWIIKVERKTDLPTLAVGHMPQERSMDVERMIEIKLDACSQVAKKVEQPHRQINDDIQHGVRAREELAAQTKVSMEACTRSAPNMDKQVKQCAREWETTCANVQEEV